MATGRGLLLQTFLVIQLNQKCCVKDLSSAVDVYVIDVYIFLYQLTTKILVQPYISDLQ